MTKRRPSNKKPSGANKSLGNALAVERERTRNKHRAFRNSRDDDLENPALIQPLPPPKNVHSVTEESSLEAFLARAQLAGTEFTAERGEMKLLSSGDDRTVVEQGPTKEQLLSDAALQLQYAHRLSIPRRPSTDQWNSAEELLTLENESFLQWRRQLAELQEVNGLVLTPFERNLELWRHLWRVVERSDIVVQIVDARNPLLFRSIDLERYVLESGIGKQNLLLVNKADMLTDGQVTAWKTYFDKQGIDAVFWSALVPEQLQSVEEEKEEGPQEMSSSENDTEDEDSEGASGQSADQSDGIMRASSDGIADSSADKIAGANAKMTDNTAGESANSAAHANGCDAANAADGATSNVEDSTVQENGSADGKNDEAVVLRSPEELISLLKQRGHVTDSALLGRPLVVGMVGYPNVGKSSTINRLLGQKKVPVSETPGRTRHLQTLNVDDQLTLCDCPGLVMPSFGFSREEMLLNCILPVDEMRDCTKPTELLASRVPRAYLEHKYGLLLPRPADHEQSDRPPTSHELLTALAFLRGFMSSKGVPDGSRAARLLVKDVVSGRLKWVAAPPDIDQKTFDEDTYSLQGEKVRRGGGMVALQQMQKRRLIESKRSDANRLDGQFFATGFAGAHILGRPTLVIDSSSSISGSTGSLAGKSWKKHGNRNKKEKLRRIYSDQNG